LSLSYAEIGLLLSVPGVVSLAVEPVLGVVAVTWRRRALVLAGGGAFAGALALAAGARSAWVLLLAFAVLYPASGAFVSLSQASLMDLQPQRRELNMARWTFVGAVGAVAGPLLLAAVAAADLGWRALFFAFAALALGLVLLASRAPDTDGDGDRPRVREALRLLVQREVFRWLLLVELSDLLLDVFLGFVALYFVDEVGTTASTGGLAVAVWTGAGLVGSAAMIPLLRRADGLAYLRASATATGVAVRRLPARTRGGREARAGRHHRRRQRRLVPGPAGSPLRRARSGQRPRAHGRRALPAERAAPARDRRHRGAVGPGGGALAAPGGTARAARVRPPAQPSAASVTGSPPQRLIARRRHDGSVTPTTASRRAGLRRA